MKNKQEHKVKSLNVLNDAEYFIVLCDNHYSVSGSHDELVQLVCNAICQNEDLRTIFLDSLNSILVTCNALQLQSNCNKPERGE